MAEGEKPGWSGVGTLLKTEGWRIWYNRAGIMHQWRVLTQSKGKPAPLCNRSP
jgi:hypothetical protein